MNAPLPPDATAVALLPLDEIVASPTNPRKRFDAAYIVELADSIKAHGLIQPITVRPLPLDALFDYNRRRQAGDDSAPKYEIVVGECRWRAAKLAGLSALPGFWRELSDQQVLEIQVVENLQRRDVHPIEEAEGYAMLMQRHGYTAEAIAAKIGKSRAYVYARLKLTALRPAAREAFYDGKLDASTALLIARIPGEALQKKATKDITQAYDGVPLSYRAAKQHIRARYTLNLQGATFSAADATLLPAAGSCSDCAKRSGNDRELFADIDHPDVCTDPDCFEAKRQARRDQLIAHAEQRQIPIYLGDQAREAQRGEIDYVSLDERLDDDAEHRSYRDILGDQAPVAALIETQWGQKELQECAEASVLETALRKAGWTPAAAAPPPGESAEQASQRLAREQQASAERADQEQRAADAEAESERRETAQAACWDALHAMEIDTDRRTQDLLYLLGEAWLRRTILNCELADVEGQLQDHLDASYRLPDEFDDEAEIPRAVALLRAAPLSRVITLLLAEFSGDEARVSPWDLKSDTERAAAAPFVTQPMSELLGVDFASLTHPISSPPETAPAGEIGAPAAPDQAKPKRKAAAKTPKAKAIPAPASPANEAAAPPKTAAFAQAWPFPTGCRP